jgi:hypothetical protein
MFSNSANSPSARHNPNSFNLEKNAIRIWFGTRKSKQLATENCLHGASFGQQLIETTSH